VTRASDKGREAENFTASYLKEHGFPHMERRTKKGRLDQGDLTGSPGLMWEVKYLGRGVRARMAEWMHEVDNQIVNANADYGILVVKPPGFGERQAGKFWAVMRWECWLNLLGQAGEPGLTRAPEVFQHSNARLTTLGARLVELDRIPGMDWIMFIPPRVINNGGLAVTTLERIVPTLHAAGYGGRDVVAGAADRFVGGSEAGRDGVANGSAGADEAASHG
jgi:hypothetical protein